MNQKEISFFDIYEKEQASFIKKFDDSDEIKIKKIGNYYYKIIEKDKSSVGKSGITFLEPLAMEYCRYCGLPAPKVVGLEEKENKALFVTEAIDGINAKEYVKNNPDAMRKIEEMCNKLKNLYNKYGIQRQMDLKDMILILEDNTIKRIIPVDFERIKYNKNINWDLVKEIADDMKINISKFLNTIDDRDEIEPQEKYDNGFRKNLKVDLTTEERVEQLYKKFEKELKEGKYEKEEQREK